MRTVNSLRHTRTRSFEERYRAALNEYAERGGETALREAYELGRAAVEQGKSLVEIASLHHETLLALTKGQGKSAEGHIRLLRAGAVFLTEALSPYEMAHRGFQDAVKTLRQLNETLEEEIKRIAHAVHDEAGQLLVAVHLALADVARGLPESEQQQLEQIKELLNQVEIELRRCSHELRPTVLDDLGLIPAIRFLAAGASKRANLPIEVRAKCNGRLRPAIEIAVYRVFQEALTNATKHAHPSRVLIKVRRTGSMLRCSIQDDGTGFDVGAVDSERGRGGLGLIGMRERLQAVGGTLLVDSAAGSGTKLLIEVPTA